MTRSMDRRLTLVEGVRKPREQTDAPVVFIRPIGADADEFRRECEEQAAGRQFVVVAFIGANDLPEVSP